MRRCTRQSTSDVTIFASIDRRPQSPVSSLNSTTYWKIVIVCRHQIRFFGLKYNRRTDPGNTLLESTEFAAQLQIDAKRCRSNAQPGRDGQSVIGRFGSFLDGRSCAQYARLTTACSIAIIGGVRSSTRIGLRTDSFLAPRCRCAIVDQAKRAPPTRRLRRRKSNLG